MYFIVCQFKYDGEEQKRIAEASKVRVEAEKLYPAPIVTEIAPLTTFYPAEGYHKNFYLNNPNQGYCRMVIDPKVSKFKKAFQDRLKGATHARV